MSFSKHINNIMNKVSQITGTFLSLKNVVPINILIKLYYALVYPHLNANVTIWMVCLLIPSIESKTE